MIGDAICPHEPAGGEASSATASGIAAGMRYRQESLNSGAIHSSLHAKGTTPLCLAGARKPRVVLVAAKRDRGLRERSGSRRLVRGIAWSLGPNIIRRNATTIAQPNGTGHQAEDGTAQACSQCRPSFSQPAGGSAQQNPLSPRFQSGVTGLFTLPLRSLFPACAGSEAMKGLAKIGGWSHRGDYAMPT